MWESVPPLQASLIASQRVSSLHTVRCRQTRQSATRRYAVGCVRLPRVLPASSLSRTPPRMVGHTMSVFAAELAADYVEEVAGWACGADGAWRLLRLLASTHETDIAHQTITN